MKSGCLSARLRLHDVERMTMTLALLDGGRGAAPVIRDVVLGAARRGADDALAAGGGPVPYCTACGALIGIFLGHGPGWRHFRSPAGAAGHTPAEVYEAGHDPVAGWRIA